MTNAPRRAAGIALALVAIVGALIGQGELRRSRDRSVRSMASQAASSKSLSAREYLSNLLQSLEAQVGPAAALQPLKNIVQTPGPIAVTLRDGFREEPWWENYRRDFSVQGVAFDGDALDVAYAAGIDKLEAGKFDVAEVVREARHNRKASLFLRAGPQDWPYATAAAVIDLPGRPVLPVLVLAKAFDLGLAREMAKKLNTTVVLSDGSHALLSAGPDEACGKLLPGNESKPSFISDDLLCAAAPTEMIPGLTLWTAQSIAAQAKDLDADTEATLFEVRLVAGLLGLLGLVLLFWPGPNPQAAAPLAPGAPAPAGTSNPNAGQLPSGVFDPALASGRSDPRVTPHAGTSNPSLARSGTYDATLLQGPPPTSGVSNPRVRPAAGTSSSDPRLRMAQPPMRVATAEDATDVHQAPILEDVTALQPLAPGGVLFGRYVLLDLLGEGGMAEVYTAVTYGAERFRRSFVVKRLRPEMLHNQAVVSSFIDEANLASSLVHSNILPVFDFGKVGDEYYMATEYILGRDLGKLSRKSIESEQQLLPMAQVLFAAHQTLEALDYAHNKKGDDGKPLGIVHRDVSPNNIMISQRGEVKLFDFGIAKSEGRLTQTTFGTVKGNVRFMSPEQARGEPVDSRSDLFSVGLVIFYVMTGDALYTGDTAYTLLVKAATGPGPVEKEAIAKLPKDAARILDRALQTNPADRYQTAAEFATALQPFIAGQQAALGRSMEKLFGPELQEEQQRFNESAGAALSNEKTSPGVPREAKT